MQYLRLSGGESEFRFSFNRRGTSPCHSAAPSGDLFGSLRDRRNEGQRFPLVSAFLKRHRSWPPCADSTASIHPDSVRAPGLVSEFPSLHSTTSTFFPRTSAQKRERSALENSSQPRQEPPTCFPVSQASATRCRICSASCQRFANSSI